LRKLSFGLFIPLSGECSIPSFIKKISCKAESLGYSNLWVEDHYRLPWTDRTLDAWIALGYIASNTSQIRIGTCVTPIPFRYPPFLAKEAATVDVLSSGRLEFSAGLGWVEKEFKSFGIPWERFRIRGRKMVEGLKLIVEAWLGEELTFRGEYYQVDSLRLEPKPIQKPYPPIWLGGSSHLILNTAITYGDGWIPWQPTLSFLGKAIKYLSKVRNGRELPKLKFGVVGHSIIAESFERAVELIPPERAEDALKGRSGSSDAQKRSPWIIGSPREIMELMEKYLKLGVNHVALSFAPRTPRHILSMAEMFAEEIISAFT